MNIKKYQPKDQVIKQGEDGNELFLVSVGTLTCSKIFANQTESTFLLKYNPGMAFGELALMYNAPRAASIVADTECILYSLDRETFNHIVKEAVIKRRERFDEFL